MKNQETAMLVDDTQESKLRGDTDQKDLVTGSVVNGFHPQLCAWQRKQTTISTSTERMDIDREICDAVSSCRSKENENIRDLVNTETLKGPKKQRRFSNEISIGNIYKDMFEDSNIAQVIATPGGRFSAWNKEFLRVCSFDPTGSYGSLTVFDLVLPSTLPQLHQIFLKSLYAECPQEEIKESNRQQYLTLTVPCIHFSQSDFSYYITLSLMYDSEPSKRCFHCILSTTPRGKVGEIYYILQDELMDML